MRLTMTNDEIDNRIEHILEEYFKDHFDKNSMNYSQDFDTGDITIRLTANDTPKVIFTYAYFENNKGMAIVADLARNGVVGEALNAPTIIVTVDEQNGVKF